MDQLGSFQNDVEGLEQLNPGRYEQIFRVYQKDSKLFYNILRRVDIDMDAIDPQAIVDTTLKTDSPWTNISYHLYGTVDLWWLIYACNKTSFKDPLQIVPGGTKLKVIKTGKLQTVLQEIESDLKPRV